MRHLRVSLIASTNNEDASHLPFVMIDPFGVSETPMTTIGRILQNPKSEVFISFMYEWINRFKDHPNFAKHLDDLFGCPDWRQGD